MRTLSAAAAEAVSPPAPCSSWDAFPAIRRHLPHCPSVRSNPKYFDHSLTHSNCPVSCAFHLTCSHFHISSDCRNQLLFVALLISVKPKCRALHGLSIDLSFVKTPSNLLNFSRKILHDLAKNFPLKVSAISTFWNAM